MAADKRSRSKPSSFRATRGSIDSIRPSSLPPELASLDMQWDDDLGPVVSPHRDPNFAFEGPDPFDEDDRPTAIPSIPIGQLVAKAMAEADEFETPPTANGEGSSGPEDEFSPPQLGAEQPLEPASSAPAQQSSSRRVGPIELDFDDLARSTKRDLPKDDSVPSQDSIPTQRRVPPVARDEPVRGLTPPPSVDPARVRMKDCYAMGDFTGALAQAESLLMQDAGDLEAQRYATSCRDVLMQMYVSRLGNIQHVVQVALPSEELRWLNLDHRAGFLLSLVDGTSTIEEVLDISGMPRLDALRILTSLLEQRVIRLLQA